MQGVLIIQNTVRWCQLAGFDLSTEDPPGAPMSAGASAAAATSVPVGDADFRSTAPKNTTGIDHRFTFPRHGEVRRHRRPTRDLPHHPGTGSCRMGVGGFRTPPAQRRPTPNRGRPALHAPFPRRLRCRPRPDDLAVRPARRIQQAPTRTVGCEVDNRLVDQTFSQTSAGSPLDHDAFDLVRARSCPPSGRTASSSSATRGRRSAGRAPASPRSRERVAARRRRQPRRRRPPKTRLSDADAGRPQPVGTTWGA